MRDPATAYARNDTTDMEVHVAARRTFRAARAMCIAAGHLGEPLGSFSEGRSQRQTPRAMQARP